MAKAKRHIHAAQVRDMLAYMAEGDPVEALTELRRMAGHEELDLGEARRLIVGAMQGWEIVLSACVGKDP
jgi:hypothetical protein